MGIIEDQIGSQYTYLELLENSPSIAVNQKLGDLDSTLETLSNRSSRSLYNAILNEKAGIVADPASWIKSATRDTLENIIELEASIGELSAIKYKRCKEVTSLRDEKVFSNIPYMFPGDTEPDIIQFRDETDRQNIQDCALEALSALNAEQLELSAKSTFYFMPLSNNIKILTAQQLANMAAFIKLRADRIYAAAWSMKGIINQLTDETAIREYDTTVGWPEETMN